MFTLIFYAQGVKANVLFFDKYPPIKGGHRTKDVWIYDLRTNANFTLVENTLGPKDLEDFVKCYNSANRAKRKESGRFKNFSYDEIIKRDKLNLDISWIKDKSLEDMENLPEPKIIAKDIIKNLKSALESLEKAYNELN